MNLENLGWNSFFSEHFEQYKEKNFFPARIFLMLKDQYQVYAEQGEITAKIAGKIHHDAASKSDFPAVGDWIVVEKESEQEEDTGQQEACQQAQRSVRRLTDGER